MLKDLDVVLKRIKGLSLIKVGGEYHINLSSFLDCYRDFKVEIRQNEGNVRLSRPSKWVDTPGTKDTIFTRTYTSLDLVSIDALASCMICELGLKADSMNAEAFVIIKALVIQGILSIAISK